MKSCQFIDGYEVQLPETILELKGLGTYEKKLNLFIALKEVEAREDLSIYGGYPDQYFLYLLIPNGGIVFYTYGGEDKHGSLDYYTDEDVEFWFGEFVKSPDEYIVSLLENYGVQWGD